MPQPHQGFGQARQHQALVADDRQQHLADGFGLLGIESALRRPVARQADFTQPLQINGHARGARAQQPLEALRRDARAAQHGLRQHGCRQLRIAGQGADDLGGLGGQGHGGLGRIARRSDSRAHVRNGIAQLRRTKLGGFHSPFS